MKNLHAKRKKGVEGKKDARGEESETETERKWRNSRSIPRRMSESLNSLILTTLRIFGGVAGVFSMQKS